MKIKNFTELSKILFENSNAILHDLVEKHTTIRNHRFKAFWRNSPDFNCAIKGNFIRDFSHQVNYNIISFAKQILQIENPTKTLAEIYFPHQIEYIFDKNEDTNLDSNQNKSTDFKINIPVVEYKEKESTEKKGLIDKKIFYFCILKFFLLSLQRLFNFSFYTICNRNNRERSNKKRAFKKPCQFLKRKYFLYKQTPTNFLGLLNFTSSFKITSFKRIKMGFHFFFCSTKLEVKILFSKYFDNFFVKFFIVFFKSAKKRFKRVFLTFNVCLNTQK